jgi:hypothetical protein
MYSWANAELVYEGFPLFLRRPTDVDTSANRQKFPDLAVITHTFTQRYPDGRPEPGYNKTLSDFDYAVVTAFDALHSGVPVLVETFGGERNYYFCIAPHADVSSIVSAIATSYQNEQLSWEVSPTKGWSFLDRYAKDFFESA